VTQYMYKCPEEQLKAEVEYTKEEVNAFFACPDKFEEEKEMLRQRVLDKRKHFRLGNTL